MKTLEEYNLIRDFLGGQGLQPTVAMVCVEDSKWSDLKFLAREWRTEQDAAEEARQAELDGLTEEELAQREREAAEEAQRQEDEVLFHSCGHRPER